MSETINLNCFPRKRISGWSIKSFLIFLLLRKSGSSGNTIQTRLNVLETIASRTNRVRNRFFRMKFLSKIPRNNAHTSEEYKYEYLYLDSRATSSVSDLFLQSKRTPNSVGQSLNHTITLRDRCAVLSVYYFRNDTIFLCDSKSICRVEWPCNEEIRFGIRNTIRYPSGWVIFFEKKN